MRTLYSASTLKAGTRKALRAAAMAALVVTAAHAFADPPVTMAPPTDPSFSQTGDGQVSDVAPASQDSVFNWKEVPANQNVPLVRAVFDRGGYQLYDAAGETIVVPFSNNNLYVMKFGLSEDGTTYFVNQGDAPVLYVPRNGYLENASAPGARWFPFPEDFQPAQPVFLGIAPSWGDYCEMGWYPNMVFYGGYWGHHPYFAGSLFTASFGLSIFIGGHHYDGWEPYRHFYDYHPAPFHVTIVDRNIYRFGGGFGGDHEYFRGTGHPYIVNRGFGGDHGFGGDRIFNGTGHPYYAHRSFVGSRDFGGFRASAPDGGHAVDGGHSFGGAHAFSGDHSFGGTHTFQGQRGGYAGDSRRSSLGVGRPVFGGGGTFAAGHFDGPRAVSQSGHSFSGARPNLSEGGGRSGGSHSDNHGSNRGGDQGGSRGGDRGGDRGGHR